MLCITSKRPPHPDWWEGRSNLWRQPISWPTGELGFKRQLLHKGTMDWFSLPALLSLAVFLSLFPFSCQRHISVSSVNKSFTLSSIKTWQNRKQLLTHAFFVLTKSRSKSSAVRKCFWRVCTVCLIFHYSLLLSNTQFTLIYTAYPRRCIQHLYPVLLPRSQNLNLIWHCMFCCLGCHWPLLPF